MDSFAPLGWRVKAQGLSQYKCMTISEKTFQGSAKRLWDWSTNSFFSLTRILRGTANTKPYVKAIDFVPTSNTIYDNAEIHQGPTKVSGWQALGAEVNVTFMNANCASSVALFELDYQELLSARSAQLSCGSLTLDCEELTAAAVFTCYLHHVFKRNSTRGKKGLSQLVSIKIYGKETDLQLI